MTPPPITVVAHRGAHAGRSAGAVENTEGAIRAAVAAFPAGIPRAIEVDLHPSQDGIPVVFHDERLLRLAGRPERIADLACEELLRIPLSGGARILTLERLFEIVPADVTLHLECKDPNPRWIEAWGDRIAAAPHPKILSSFYPSVAEAAAKRFEIHHLTVQPGPDAIREARRLGATGLDLSLRRAETGPAWADENGLDLYLYVVNDAEALARARACGARGVFSDDPVEVLAALG